MKPLNNSRLNYTQMLFEVDEVAKADSYRLHIINSLNPEKNFIIGAKSLACISSDSLGFGQKYQWYLQAQKVGNPVFKSGLYSFSTSKSIWV